MSIIDEIKSYFGDKPFNSNDLYDFASADPFCRPIDLPFYLEIAG